VDTVKVKEADEVSKKGMIILPCYGGQPHGHVENRPKGPKVINGFLLLPSGKQISWTPASKIGW